MRTQRGFTLVEIAIVLVIIGLLLGGILKGQELIISARVRNMADQSSGVQAAYYGFVDRYRKIPGDMKKETVCSTLGSVALPNCKDIGGNGDGRIVDYPEASAVWAHLAAAGFIQGSYNSITSTAANDPAYVAGTHAPTNVFGGRLILHRGTGYHSNTATATDRLHLVLGRNAPVGVAKELDTKLDDGMPDRGVLRSVQSTSGTTTLDSGANCVKSPASDAAGDAAGAKEWDIAGAADDCNTAFLY